MNDYENKILTDLKIFCPKEVVAKYKHKHTKEKDWTRFFYYKSKRRHFVSPTNIEYDYEVSSTLAYNKNVFYKMTTMSNQDTFFDYYFKLKNELQKIVVKKSNRLGNSQRTSTKTLLSKPLHEYNVSEDGKFICHFK